VNGLPKTPNGNFYFLSFIKCPRKNQPAIVAALDAYLRGIVSCGKFTTIFHHVAVSREDPEMILSFQAYPSKEDALFYWNVSE
jgi:hypothetical protein